MCVLDRGKRFSGGRSKIVHQFQSHLMMTKYISLKTTSEEARTLLVIWHFFFNIMDLYIVIFTERHA